MAQMNGGGRRNMRGMPRPKVNNPKQLFSRIMKELFSHYGFQMIIVVICIVVSVFANVLGTLFT